MRFYKDTRQIEYYLEKYNVLEMFEDPEKYRSCFLMAEIRKRENVDYAKVGDYLFFMLEGRLKVYSRIITLPWRLSSARPVLCWTSMESGSSF